MNKLTKEQRKKNMQAVKATGSKIEVALAKSLLQKVTTTEKTTKPFSENLT